MISLIFSQWMNCMFLVLLLYAFFACVFAIAKTGLEYSAPFFLVGSRMLLAGIILLAYQKFYKKESFSFNKPIWNQLLQLSFFCIYLTNVLEFWGLKYLTAVKTCFLYSLSPFVSALLCYLLFREKLTNKKWLGLLIGFAGFVPVLLAQTTSEELAGSFFIFSWAELAVVGAVVASAYGWILLKQLIQLSLSPLTINGFSMLIGGSLALIHSLLVENWDPIPVTNFPIYLECTILLIIISNFVCYNLYGYLLGKFSATFISFVGLTTPIFTGLIGWFFLGETVTWPFYLSYLVVFSGLFLFDQEELKHSPSVPIEISDRTELL